MSLSDGNWGRAKRHCFGKTIGAEVGVFNTLFPKVISIGKIQGFKGGNVHKERRIYRGYLGRAFC